MSNITDLPPEKVRDMWTGHARRLLRQIPGCRHYAFTDAQVRAIASNLAVWWQQQLRKTGGTFTDKGVLPYLRELLKVIPGAMQDWRPGESPTLPEIPKDPVTGQPMRNPHEEPKDLTSISQLAVDDPALNEHLKEIAQAGGSTYARIKRLHEQEEAQKLLRGFDYGDSEHAQNALRGGSITQRNDFAAKLPGQHLLPVYKFEATTPVEIPWHPTKDGRPHHVTRMMKITRRNPDMRALIEAGLALEKQWVQRDLEIARGSEAEIARTRAAAEALLNPKKVPA
jgi:hypothetical protein